MGTFSKHGRVSMNAEQRAEQNMKVAAEATFVRGRPQINSIETVARTRSRMLPRGGEQGGKRLRERRVHEFKPIIGSCRRGKCSVVSSARRCVEISGNNELPHPVIAA